MSHIPGKQNVGADTLLRSVVDHHDWRLDTTVFQAINSPRGRLVCVQDYETAADQLAEAVDADVNRVHGLCKPSMGPDRSLCAIQPSAGRNDSAYHSVVARSALVPDPVPSLTGQSKVTSIVPRPSK